MELMLLLGAVVVLIVSCLIQLVRYRRGTSRYPPGPMPLPFLGNVHQLPVAHQELTFLDWGKRYGDIIFAKLFHKPAIIINSLDVARDLMEKRSSNYSDRPAFVLLEEMLGWKNAVTQMPYGDQHRMHRKWMADTFIAKSALLSYQPMQRRERNAFLAGLLEYPDSFVAQVRRYTAALIAEIVFGYRISGLNDEYVLLAEDASTQTVQSGSPGSSILSLLVDFFPILQHYPMWLPGSGFRRRLNGAKEVVAKLRSGPYEKVKEQMAQGVASPSFVANLIEQHSAKGYLTAQEEEDIKGASAVFYAAGTDTTASVLASFLLCMVRNPDVFKKAQEEIDRVIGRDRLPDFEDEASLPYLQCVIKEVYRWTAPLPLCMPHASLENDEYQGLMLPGGSMIVPNVWAMTRDERLHKNPEAFVPERYMKGTTEGEVSSEYVFGFGRRLCPGQDFAHANFFMIAASVIATMTISKARDESQRKITPPPSFIGSFVRHPKPFLHSIRPRDQEAIDLITHVNSSL